MRTFADHAEVKAYFGRDAANQQTGPTATWPSIDALCAAGQEIGWVEKRSGFLTPSAEELLRRLHFRRDWRFSEQARRNILGFLLEGYGATRDVRYYNELLWFMVSKKEGWELHIERLAAGLFHMLVDARGVHPFPHGRIEDTQQWLEELSIDDASLSTFTPNGRRVGLLGSPWFFRSLAPALRSKGLDTRHYVIRHHFDRAPRMLLRHPWLHDLFLSLTNSPTNYVDLGDDPTSDAIGQRLRLDELDVCFHKLGFIIKSGTLSGSRLGIINDHWGLLPYVRGRSTVEWSLLHGIPVAATLHLVDPGIDTGRLIVAWSYEKQTEYALSVADVRKAVRRDGSRRALAALLRLLATEGFTLTNATNVGATYYSMHPALVRYLEATVLPSRRKMAMRAPPTTRVAPTQL